jgi:hypothetical protein
MIYAGGAQAFIEVENDLDVASGAEAVALFLEPSPQHGTVIDFAVADQMNVTRFVADRLMATIDVDDTETTEAQSRFAGSKVPIVIRTPMDQRGSHFPGDFRCPLTYGTRNPAHQVKNLTAGGRCESGSRLTVGFPIKIEGCAEAIPQ